jgi:hypothetical protein
LRHKRTKWNREGKIILKNISIEQKPTCIHGNQALDLLLKVFLFLQEHPPD